MSEEQKSSVEIQIELEAAEKEKSAIVLEIDTIETRLAYLKSRKDELDGGHWNRRSGLIGRLKEDLDSALLLEKDKNALVIRWVKGKSGYSDEYILDKVTTKQISIRYAGHTRTDRFNLDGTSVSRYRSEQIDIRSTFGIDADSVPPNWKPPK